MLAVAASWALYKSMGSTAEPVEEKTEKVEEKPEAEKKEEVAPVAVEEKEEILQAAVVEVKAEVKVSEAPK